MARTGQAPGPPGAPEGLEKKFVGSCRSGGTAVRPGGERVRRRPETEEDTVKYMMIMRASDEAYAAFEAEHVAEPV